MATHLFLLSQQCVFPEKGQSSSQTEPHFLVFQELNFSPHLRELLWGEIFELHLLLFFFLHCLLRQSFGRQGGKHDRRSPSHGFPQIYFLLSPHVFRRFVGNGVEFYLYLPPLFLLLRLPRLFFLYGLKQVKFVGMVVLCLFPGPFNRFKEVRLFFLVDHLVLIDVFNAIIEDAFFLQLVQRVLNYISILVLCLHKGQIILSGFVQEVEEVSSRSLAV